MKKDILESITVLDLSRVLSAPYATMHLGDMGADVIKVEDTKTGDETRHIPPLISEGTSYYNISLNRNKRSICIDLKSPDGHELVKGLAAKSDVIVSNFRPGVMDRLGLSYEQLRKVNPRIIYAVVSGYGTTGTLSQHAGYDVCAQAMSGIMSVTGEPDGEPTRVGVFIADHLAGLNLEIGILAALYEREFTGEGQYLEVALTDAALSVTLPACSRIFASDESPGRTGNIDPGVAPSSCFQASDGKFVLSCGNQSLWERLCRQVLNCPELIEKPQYSDNAHRLEHNAELMHIVSEWAANKSVADCIRECSDAGLPCAPVWDLKQAYNSSFYREERRMFITVPTPDGAAADTLAQPIVFSSHPRRLRFPPPQLGQHTDEILRQKLDIPQNIIDAYHRMGVIK